MKVTLIAFSLFLGMLYFAAHATKSNTERYKRIFGQGYYHAN